MRTRTWACALGCVGLITGACGGDATTSNGPTAVAAVYSLAWAISAVAGDDVEVVEMTPRGVEPHDLELTPSQVKTLAQADLVVYIGEGFQPAVEDIVADDPEDAIDALSGTEVISTENGIDPHIWLDPLRLIDVVTLVEETLAERFPDRAAAFERRTTDLIDDLRALDGEIAATLADCERREIVTSHDAFGYLAARYGLEQIPISGLSPEAEPSPQRIAEVAGIARGLGVTTIFFETLVSPDVAETIASEIGVDTAVLDPIESEPESGNYLGAMRANAAALGEALACR